MQIQFKIMKQAVAECLSIELKIMGESVPSQLDSSSMVSLMWQDHFNRYFRPQLGPAEGSVADTHHLFDLTSASGGAIPLSRYVELDVEFLGLPVPRVRFLITQFHTVASHICIQYEQICSTYIYQSEITYNT